MIHLIELGKMSSVKNNKIQVNGNRWINTFTERDWQNGTKYYKIHHLEEKVIETLDIIDLTIEEVLNNAIIHTWKESCLTDGTSYFILSPKQDDEN